MAGEQHMAPSFMSFEWCGFVNDEYLVVQFSDNCGSPTFTYQFGGSLYNPSICGVLNLVRLQGCTGCCSGHPSLFGLSCGLNNTPLCDTTACLDNTGCVEFDPLLFQNSCAMTTTIIGQDTLLSATGPAWEYIDAYYNCISC